MTINGREIHFAYTTWAYVEYNEWLVKNPDVSVAKARVQLAIIMHKAYLDANGIKGEKCLTPEELYPLPVGRLEMLLKEAENQRAEDSKTDIEVEGKNAKSAAAE